MTEGQKLQTQIGLGLWLASIVMFIAAIMMKNFGLLVLSFPVGFIGFYNALRPWVRNRQIQTIRAQQDREDVIAIQRQRRRRELEKALYDEE
jgi:hypothetical protein